MELQELDDIRSLEDLLAYQRDVSGRMTEINLEFAGRPLPEGLRDEFSALNDQSVEIDKRARELEARAKAIERFGNNANNTEREDPIFDTRDARGSMRERDIYDLSTIPVDLMNPERTRQALRDRAMRAVEIASFPHLSDPAPMRGRIESLLERDTDEGELARRILATGSPAYKRGFAKYVLGKQASWTSEEARAMALGAGSTGGYAVVYQLDPTFVPTSNLAVNPFRGLSKIVELVGTNEWRGVTAGAVTAAYAAEATEASDNSPTLAQPDVTVQRAQCFIPISIEATQDINGLQGELAGLIQDSKDVLEATKFTTGSGTGEPQGVLTGATQTLAAGGTASFAVSDVYNMEGTLGARFRPNAAFVANRSIYNKVRQFDTSGGEAMWVGYPNPLQGGLANNPPRNGGLELRLIGYPTYEDSAMASALTSANKIMVLGDFRYYVIVDRIGLDIEVVPHLFGATNRFPTGQRGIYAYWRNSAAVLSSNAFVVLVTG